MMRDTIDRYTGDNRVTAAGWLVLAASLICATTRAQPTPPGPLEVGQRWGYRHEGPRPGSIEPNAIDGERIRWVLAAEQGREGRQWIIEERFTHDPKVIGLLHINEDGFMEALDVQNDKGESLRLRYDPPVPYQPGDMAVGETRTLATTVRMDTADFVLPSKTLTERLADENVTTPAGDFPGCSHYRSVTTSTINVKIAKIPLTEEREQWYHPAVHGMVKEVYRRGPVKFLGWSRAGYTATSVLTTYDRQEPRAIGRSPDPNGLLAPQEPPPTPRAARTSRRSPARLIVPAVVLAAALGGLRARKRARKKRATHG